MNKNDSYKDCYRILGISPSCSWPDLRKTYKKSIQKWHPDRFDDDSKEKEVAIDKIKSINIAYKQIHKYYQDNGTLPPVEEPTRAKPTKKEPAARPETPTKPQTSTPGSAARKKPAGSKKTSKATYISSTILLTTLGASYYFFADNFYLEKTKTTQSNISLSNQAGQPHPSSSDINSTEKPAMPLKHLKDNLTLETPTENTQLIQKSPYENPQLEAFFTSGSSIADVIDIQGAPTKTEGDVWFYGNSEVHFKNGEVSYWVRSAKNPLKARMTFNPAEPLNTD